MFYRPDQADHGLPHNPFKALVAPRPIGWITTVSAEGVVNLAPYSYFNAMATDPPVVVFGHNGAHAEGGAKDTLANIEATGEFVCNIATWDLREAMNRTSAPVPREVDEMALAGLEAEPARLVRPPRVKGAPAHFECVHLTTVALPCTVPGTLNRAVFGRVVGVHIDESVIVDGRVDVTRIRPIARLGYMDYTVVERVFTMDRPGG